MLPSSFRRKGRTFENEERILINSLKVATYDLKPEMSAPEVTDPYKGVGSGEI